MSAAHTLEPNDGYISEEDEDYEPDMCEINDDNDAMSGEEEESLDVSVILNSSRRGKKKYEDTNLEVVCDEECTTGFLDDLYDNPNLAPPCVMDNTSEKIAVVSTVYKFAGEKIRYFEILHDDLYSVEEEVDADQIKKGKKKAAKAVEVICPKKKFLMKKIKVGEIDGVVARIRKVTSLSTLRKTTMDWKKYKAELNVEAELKQEKKGKKRYMDRVAFLHNTEAKTHEKELAIKKFKAF